MSFREKMVYRRHNVLYFECIGKSTITLLTKCIPQVTLLSWNVTEPFVVHLRAHFKTAVIILPCRIRNYSFITTKIFKHILNIYSDNTVKKLQNVLRND
jgi:hypothetical protein